MRILVAGATGAIGNPLISQLVKDGHEVYGITHSEERAQVLAGKGAKPLHLDVFDRETVFTNVERLRPEVVIDMLTSLPKEYTPQAMADAAPKDARVRLEGGKNLLDAAEKSGTNRYILQSSAFWYAPGPDFADESSPFAFDASPGIAAGCKVYSEIEKRLLQSSKIQGVALRFGFFYGPGTWFEPQGNAGEQVKQKKFPQIGDGEGVWNFIHIEDAANAISEALYINPGAYNIVNNYPKAMKEWLPAFARYVQGPPPPHITEEEGLKIAGADSVYYATKLRAVSNAKAKREFNFQPRSFEWFL